MKKKYMTPILIEDSFVTNESISACWGVNCNVPYEGGKDSLQSTHRIETCGKFDHQYVYTNGNNVAIGMAEVKHDMTNKNLPCTLTDSTYKNKLTETEIAAIQPGQTIYWKTELFGSIYQHYGVVGVEDSKFPNRS